MSPGGIILDTNVISEPTRPRPDATVEAWFSRQSGDRLYLTSVIVSEVAFGVALVPDGRRRRTLEGWLRNTVLTTFQGRILPFDEEDALIYGRLMAAARAMGTPARVGDAQIAATALSHGFAIATRNVADFAIFNVRLINPWRAPE